MPNAAGLTRNLIVPDWRRHATSTRDPGVYRFPGKRPLPDVSAHAEPNAGRNPPPGAAVPAPTNNFSPGWRELATKRVGTA